MAVRNRPKRLSNTMLDSSPLALDLAVFFKVTIAPVGRWKSGAGWANRWAGGSLPVHGFVHALEPRSARQGRFPPIHGRQNQGGRDAAETAAGGRPAPFMVFFARCRHGAIPAIFPTKPRSPDGAAWRRHDERPSRNCKTIFNMGLNN